MKILVDKMPRTPNECLFSTAEGSYCNFVSSEKCYDVKHCRFLMANATSQYISKLIYAATKCNEIQSDILSRCINEKDSVTNEEICRAFDRTDAINIIAEIREVSKAEACCICINIVSKNTCIE